PLVTFTSREFGTFTSRTQVVQGVISPMAQSLTLPLSPIYKNFSAFFQDDWRVNERLALSLGLRWELNPAPTDKYGNTPYAVDQVTNPATIKAAAKGTPLWATTYGNFAPRFGVSYHLRQAARRETILRGGLGVFYDLGNTYASQGYESGIGI